MDVTKRSVTLATLLLAAAPSAQQSVFPGQTWMQYAAPEQAGFSSEKLAAAHEYWQSTPSAAYLIVYRGAVVAAWGNVERRYMCHSVRKSFLSGLIGVHVDGRGVNVTGDINPRTKRRLVDQRALRVDCQRGRKCCREIFWEISSEVDDKIAAWQYSEARVTRCPLL